TAQFFPDDGGELRLAGADDDDLRVFAGPEPPEDEAGDEVILADGVARVDDGIAAVGDGVGDFDLAPPVARPAEDDRVERIGVIALLEEVFLKGFHGILRFFIWYCGWSPRRPTVLIYK